LTALLGPRFVVAGTQSGVGKTTVATGIMAALAARGRRVGAAKVGPDYIDPGYHAIAAGRPSRNLDPWMCGEDIVAPVAGRAGAGCDVLVVEGVMGLFDGAAGSSSAGRATASTAHVALLLAAPVLLVVDAAAMSTSVAALVHGFSTFDPSIRIGGLVLNRVGSASHESLLRDALAPLGVPILGVLRRDPDLTWRDRHLGLIPVIEQRAEVRRSLDRLARAVSAGCDLAAIEELARSAPPREAATPPLPRRRVGETVRIAVAAGPAFSFTYPDNAEALEAGGAELVPFDPLVDTALPAGVGGLVVGGGFPEVYAEHLGANRPLLDDARARIDAGLVTWAECGGLLWLSRSLDGVAMAGALPCAARMTDHLTLGYRAGVVRGPSPWGPAGTPIRGHEFHYSIVDPAGDALATVGREGATSGGFVSPSLMASYVHTHLGGTPEVAERFLAAASACQTDGSGGL
jgi:cobyrinic acid a,c-diamide synthase